MKKQFKILALLLVVAMIAVVAVACTPALTVGDSGTVTVVVANPDADPTEYVVDLSKLNGQEGLMTVLDYLKENNGLTYTEVPSDYGAYLTQVNNIKEDGANGIYLYLYTTVAADADVSEYAKTMDYKGITLTSSGVGSSSMHIEDGAVIYIGTIKY